MSPNKELRQLFDQYCDEIEAALLIRSVEQQLLKLFDEGKLFGTIHTSIGQEFCGVAVNKWLQDQDYVFSNHRCHGHFLSYCDDPVGLLAEVMGKDIGVCGGRGGSQHLYFNRFFSNGIQGGIAPIAAGLAYSNKIEKNNGIAVVFIGDGTLGQGVLYESLNLLSVWDLPLLIVCENNHYAQSTDTTTVIGGAIIDRPKAFGIKTRQGNTWDWSELIEDMGRAISYVRENNKPLFYEIDTYRLMAHSKGDDTRDVEEINKYVEKDPLNVLSASLKHVEGYLGVVNRVEKRVSDAVKHADQAGFGDINKEAQKSSGDTQWLSYEAKPEKIVDGINRGLKYAVESKDAILIGEDIESPYGGAFKCTKNISAEFPDNVKNTPISEAGIVGIANGLALSGRLPIVEIMFGDFLLLAADQWINHAAKFRWLYNDKVTVPIIVRTPMGGKRGYGATHSQSLEKHFLGVPDTQVLSIHHRYSPEQLYKDVCDTIELPTLIIENKVLYGYYTDTKEILGYALNKTNEMFPTINLKPIYKPSITVVSVGGTSKETEKALLDMLYEEEIVFDLFLPVRLYPFNIDVLIESLTSTTKLLIVDEGQRFASIGSEIIASIHEQYPGVLKFVKRVNAEEMAIPSARPLESKCLPGSKEIAAAALELHREQ